MRTAAIASAALLVAVLAGCSAEAATPPTAVPVEEPSATAAPEGLGAGAPRFDLTCDDVAFTGEFAPLATAPRSRTYYSGYEFPSISDSAGIAAAGGLECAWAPATEEAWINLQILPDADAGWALHFEGRGLEVPAAGTPQLACPSEDGSCRLDLLTGGYWLHAVVAGAVNSEDAAQVVEYFDSLTQAVSGLGEPLAPWSPSAETLAVPTACEGFLTDDQVMAAQHSSLARPLPQENPYPTLSDYAGHAAGLLRCAWTDTINGAGVRLDSLPAGSWALGGALASPSTDPTLSSVEPVAVEGLAADDGAWVICSTPDYCWVNLDLGGNWVSVFAASSNPQALNLSVPARDVAVELAATVVANIG